MNGSLDDTIVKEDNKSSPKCDNVGHHKIEEKCFYPDKKGCNYLIKNGNYWDCSYSFVSDK
ncbi:hypothetical protein CMI39_02525 [Candidatus Pacearchaeota archaeon]|jgi:hypothetical protein|nr:hypothetical protein [Candidatus Pacearchaeota archaeon]|tara:strand:- start:16042 stop:16224 length:183 start_codon:yes stop_codon:yes gene_type:complete